MGGGLTAGSVGSILEVGVPTGLAVCCSSWCLDVGEPPGEGVGSSLISQPHVMKNSESYL